MPKFHFVPVHAEAADVASEIGSDFVAFDVLRGRYDSHESLRFADLCATELVLLHGPTYPSGQTTADEYYILPEKLDSDAVLACYLNMNFRILNKSDKVRISQYAHKIDFLTKIEPLNQPTFASLLSNINSVPTLSPLGVIHKVFGLLDQIISHGWALDNLPDLPEANPVNISLKQKDIERHTALKEGCIFSGRRRASIPHLFIRFEFVIWKDARGTLTIYYHPTKTVPFFSFPPHWPQKVLYKGKIVKLFARELIDVVKIVECANHQKPKKS